MRNGLNSAYTPRIDEKRATFLRRIDVKSQSEWILHDGNVLRTWMSGYAGATLPTIADQVVLIENLNRQIFSRPHPEEWSFMTASPVTTQDAVPPATNLTFQVMESGNYVSPRTTINGVTLGCYRQLRKYNSTTGTVDLVQQIESRPYQFCAGGVQYQPDHFWFRNNQWSEMMSDLTVDAAQNYAQAIKDAILESTDGISQLGRLTVVSNFESEDSIDFTARESDLVSPFLRHLRVPAKILTNEITGLSSFAETGALLFSLPREQAKTRFLKGDSGAILLLDGVPIATLYSVDGEETSGGASIRTLPDAAAEDAPPVETTEAAAQSRKGSALPVSCLKM